MKKDSISISFESESLRAIKKYMGKKDVDLEDELVDQLEKLYKKHVPVNVREYIDDKKEEEQKAKKTKKTSKNADTSISAHNKQG